YNPAHVGVSFRLGGETRTLSLLELGWRIGLYSEEESRLDDTRRGLNKGEIVRDEVLTMGFWPSIGDDEFVVGGTAVKKGVRDKDLTCGGMFVTRIARSFGLLTNAMLDALSVEPMAHIFKKKSLIAINVGMDLGRGACCCPATRQVGEDDDVEEAANEEVGGSAEVYRNISHGD
ncbi:hypothetical protein Tco_0122248, partial [Tanacetum coccineum]